MTALYLPFKKGLLASYNSIACKTVVNACKCIHTSSSNWSATTLHKDLIVIGGGSGGLACAKAAADYGKDVAIIDYVAPTPKGTKWDIGGTCVNVGCIPKKLMHFAALTKQSISNASSYGWSIDTDYTHSWEKLAHAVQMHIRSLNWGYKVQLAGKSVTYINGYGKFMGDSTVNVVNQKGKEFIIHSKNILVSVGLRPKYPNIPGAETHCITSDDIFWKKESPGKTLVIGGSYVGLECAGFLHGLNLDTTVMIRSIPLRGFDEQMAKLVTDYMEGEGIKIQWSRNPTSFEKSPSGKIEVKSQCSATNDQFSEVFDTVLIATGRHPTLHDMGLERAGVLCDKSSGKIVVDDMERTNVKGIFAIGDVALNRPELTPVAIKAGKMLAERLFNGSSDLMDYTNIPTTVFTPLEYSCVGLSEEQAIDQYGLENVEIYHAFYRPLEFALPNQNADQCFIKVVCLTDQNEPILGIHFIGPNAGEVMQGFSCAINAGLTYKQLSHTVGIHPTSAEELVKVNITKRSGKDPTVTGC